MFPAPNCTKTTNDYFRLSNGLSIVLLHPYDVSPLNASTHATMVQKSLSSNSPFYLYPSSFPNLGWTWATGGHHRRRDFEKRGAAPLVSQNPRHGYLAWSLNKRFASPFASLVWTIAVHGPLEFWGLGGIYYIKFVRYYNGIGRLGGGGGLFITLTPCVPRYACFPRTET